MTDYRDHIISDHRVQLGKPVIKGTRLTVEMIVRKLSEGATNTDLIRMYPGLTEADIRAVLQYAAELLAHEEPVVPAA